MVPERESSVQIVPYRYERSKWTVCRDNRHLTPEVIHNTDQRKRLARCESGGVACGQVRSST